MTIPDAKEKWSGRVNPVTIGATRAEGGTRGRTVTIGGQSGIPFLSFDGEMPHPPAIALDVLDKEPTDWPKPLADAYGDVWSDPAAWARRVKELGADLVSLRLVGTHPDEGDRSPQEAAETVKAILAAVDLPLIIWGCDVPAKDQAVMPKVAEAAQGENCLLGSVTETEYRTLTAAAQAYGHKLIALSPCDINKAKQINILVSDMGYPLDRRGDLPEHGRAGLRHGVHLLDPGAGPAGGAVRRQAHGPAGDPGRGLRGVAGQGGPLGRGSGGAVGAGRPARPGLGGGHRHRSPPRRSRPAGDAPPEGGRGGPEHDPAVAGSFSYQLSAIRFQPSAISFRLIGFRPLTVDTLDC